MLLNVCTFNFAIAFSYAPILHEQNKNKHCLMIPCKNANPSVYLYNSGTSQILKEFPKTGLRVHYAKLYLSSNAWTGFIRFHSGFCNERARSGRLRPKRGGKPEPCNLRLADRDHNSEYEGPFEIVSITGTISVHGSHLHISISDGDGRTIGGHFESGCKIYTTAEIVIAVFQDVIYKREFAEDSGYEELAVYYARANSPGSYRIIIRDEHYCHVISLEHSGILPDFEPCS